MYIIKLVSFDFVIFTAGERSHESKNIEWELKVAKKFKKLIYIIKLNTSSIVPVVVNEIVVTSEEDFYSFIDEKLNVNKRVETILFNNKNSLKDNCEEQKMLLEEYKLLL